MAHFMVEVSDGKKVFNEKTKQMDIQMVIIEKKYVDLPCNTVDEALKDSKIVRLKADAKAQGFGFRVRRED